MSERRSSRASKGGRARAAKLTVEERRQIGIAGSLARWGKKLPAARYGSVDEPLRVEGIEIACYVLDDDRRVLEQRGVAALLSLGEGDAGVATGRRLATVLESLAPGVPRDARGALAAPVLFHCAGTTAYGYEAALLDRLCETVLAARDRGDLGTAAATLTERCEAIRRVMGEGGVAGLVDQATGVVDSRTRDRVVEGLIGHVRDEMKAWVGTFPAPFFRELYRLCELDYPPDRKVPSFLGQLTDDVVYGRLHRGARAEMDRLAPAGRRGETGSGEPLALREHLASVITLMKISRGYDDFEGHLDTALPRHEHLPTQSSRRGQ